MTNNFDYLQPCYDVVPPEDMDINDEMNTVRLYSTYPGYSHPNTKPPMYLPALTHNMIEQAKTADHANRYPGISGGLYKLTDSSTKSASASTSTSTSASASVATDTFKVYPMNIIYKTEVPIIHADAGMVRRYSPSDDQPQSKMTNKTFRRLFDEMCPWLSGVDWYGMAVAGGAISSILFKRSPGDSSDAWVIDIFFYGLSEIEILAKIDGVISHIKSRPSRRGDDRDRVSIDKGWMIHRTDNCITLTYDIQYHPRFSGIFFKPCQFVMRRYNHLSEILHGFDLGSSAFLYDGSNVYTTAGGKLAAKYRINFLDTNLYRSSYTHRIEKYLNRGFGFVLPDLNVREPDLILSTFDDAGNAVITTPTIEGNRAQPYPPPTVISRTATTTTVLARQLPASRMSTYTLARTSDGTSRLVLTPTPTQNQSHTRTQAQTQAQTQTQSHTRTQAQLNAESAQSTQSDLRYKQRTVVYDLMLMRLTVIQRHPHGLVLHQHEPTIIHGKELNWYRYNEKQFANPQYREQFTQLRRHWDSRVYTIDRDNHKYMFIPRWLSSTKMTPSQQLAARTSTDDDTDTDNHDDHELKEPNDESNKLNDHNHNHNDHNHNDHSRKPDHNDHNGNHNGNHNHNRNRKPDDKDTDDIDSGEKVYDSLHTMYSTDMVGATRYIMRELCTYYRYRNLRLTNMHNDRLSMNEVTVSMLELTETIKKICDARTKISPTIVLMLGKVCTDMKDKIYRKYVLYNTKNEYRHLYEKAMKKDIADIVTMYIKLHGNDMIIPFNTKSIDKTIMFNSNERKISLAEWYGKHYMHLQPTTTDISKLLTAIQSGRLRSNS